MTSDQTDGKSSATAYIGAFVCSFQVLRNEHFSRRERQETDGRTFSSVDGSLGRVDNRARPTLTRWQGQNCLSDMRTANGDSLFLDGSSHCVNEV